jgi:hypothetical protein
MQTSGPFIATLAELSSQAQHAPRGAATAFLVQRGGCVRFAVAAISMIAPLDLLVNGDRADSARVRYRSSSSRAT